MTDAQYMQSMGERLALLLAAADLPDEVKEGLIALVPEMNPEQLKKLMTGLESKISSGDDIELARLQKSVERVNIEHDAAVKASQEKASKALDHVADLLKQGEDA